MSGAKTKGLVGLGLLALAVVALIVPGIGFVRAVTDGGVVLAGGSQTVTVSAHQKYGIYVDHEGNGTKSVTCTITDGGRAVALSKAGWSLSFSDTEVLDHVFDSGSGHLVVECATPEKVTIRPVPNYLEMVVGAGIAFVLGLIGFMFLVVLFLDGLVSRREKRLREEDEPNEEFPSDPPA